MVVPGQDEQNFANLGVLAGVHITILLGHRHANSNRSTMLALRGTQLTVRGGRLRCCRPASTVFIPLVHDTREINYRGSKKFQELRALSPIVAEEAAATRSPQRLQFLEAIHLHKYNKSYDRLFESLGELAEQVIDRPLPDTTPFDLTVARSFEHHCRNPRYGYSSRAHSRRSDLLARVSKFLAGHQLAVHSPEMLRPSSTDRLVTMSASVDVPVPGDAARVRREGPTWWQTLLCMSDAWEQPTRCAPC